jgi:hypothetical protein
MKENCFKKVNSDAKVRKINMFAEKMFQDKEYLFLTASKRDIIQHKGTKGAQWKKGQLEGVKEDGVSQRVENGYHLNQQSSVQKILNSAPFSKKSRNK